MTAPDFETDHAAIITAIEGECAAYFAKDFDLWASFWVQAAPIRRWNWHADVGMTFHAGWEQESRSIGDGMRRFPSPMVNDVRRDWLHFVISADLAWVTFDQHSAGAGDPFQVTGRQHEMRIMQKCAGRWLTACVSSLKPRAEIAPCPLIRVDATGRVIAMNAHAMARLQGHPGLIAVNDRLRARNRATDRALQAAIVWASGALGYAQKRMSQRDTAATGGAVPVLDDGATEGPAVLCWVTPADGMILVTFDDQTMADRRMAAAGLVFRLSKGQVRLAKLLMGGLDLAEAALQMGVSVNTVRTQLRRIFDKTGVHNQAALVRVLLSIAPPLG